MKTEIMLHFGNSPKMERVIELTIALEIGAAPCEALLLFP